MACQIRTYVRYTEGVEDRAEKEAMAAELELEIAQVCGVMNATAGRLVSLIARVLETESWQGWGVRSASHWVAWKCGVSPARARTLVLMARRLAELPETRAAFDAGELCEDQVAVVCRHAPAAADAAAAAEVAMLARSATVVQLRRVLGTYPFDDEAKGDPTEPKEPEAPAEPRRASFGTTDRGTWQLSAELPAERRRGWRGSSARVRRTGPTVAGCMLRCPGVRCTAALPLLQRPGRLVASDLAARGVRRGGGLRRHPSQVAGLRGEEPPGARQRRRSQRRLSQGGLCDDSG